MASKQDEVLSKQSQTPRPLLGASAKNWRLGLYTEAGSIDTDNTGLEQAVNCDLIGSGQITRKPSLVPYGDGATPGELASNTVTFSKGGNAYLAAAFKTSSTRASVYIKEGDGGAWTAVEAVNLENRDDRLHLFEADKYIVVLGGRVDEGENTIRLIDIEATPFDDQTVSREENPFRGSGSARSLLDTASLDHVYNYVVTLVNEHGLETGLSPPVSIPVNKLRSQWSGRPNAVDLVFGQREVHYLYKSGSSAAQVRKFNPDDDADEVIVGSLPNTDTYKGLAKGSRRYYSINTSRRQLWEIDVDNPSNSRSLGTFPGGLDAGASLTVYNGNLATGTLSIGDIFLVETNGDFWVLDPSNPGSTSGYYGRVKNLNGYSGISISSSRVPLIASDPSGETFFIASSGNGSGQFVELDRTTLLDSSVRAGTRASYQVNIKDTLGDERLFSGDFGGMAVSYDRRLYFNRASWSVDPTLLSSEAQDSEGDTYSVQLKDVTFIDNENSDTSSRVEGASFAMPSNFPEFYNVYISYNDGPYYLLKEELDDPIFVDQGESATGRVDVSKRAPQSNETVLPNAKKGLWTGARIILYDDPDHPNRIYYGGFEDKLLAFTRGENSGYIGLSVSRGDTITNITPYFTEGASPTLSVFTSSQGVTTGEEHTLSPARIVLADGFTTIPFTSFKVGEVGTESPYGPVLFLESLYRPTAEGFMVKGARPRSQDLFLSDTIDQTIRTRSLNVDVASLRNSVGTLHRQKIYWAMSEGNTTEFRNNKIWVLNLTQGEGSWMCDWDVPSDHIFTHRDDSGRRLLMVIRGREILRFTEPGDNTEPILWRFRTNKLFIPAREYYDAQKIGVMAVAQPYFIISKLLGHMRLIIKGRTEDSLDGEVATKDIRQGDSFVTSGSYGSFVWGESDFDDPSPIPPDNPEDPSGILYIPLEAEIEDNLVQWLYVEVQALSPDASCVVHDFVWTYKFAGPSDLDEATPE